MFTLQVFRTKSKDYEESFRKMENFVKEHNLSVAEYAKSNGDKDILQDDWDDGYEDAKKLLKEISKIK